MTFFFADDGGREAEQLAVSLRDASFNVWFHNWQQVDDADGSYIPYRRLMYPAMEMSRSALIFVTAGGFGPWVQPEFPAALGNARRDPFFRLIPVLGPSATEADIPEVFRYYQFLDYRQRSSAIFDQIVELVSTSSRKDWLPPPQVFLCHAKEDSELVGKLYTILLEHRISPWLDSAKLVVGDHWKSEITGAIETSHFFVICLSRTALRKRGFIQKELRLAITEYQRRPPGTTFILPVWLDRVDPPRIELDETTTLQDLQGLDASTDPERAFHILATSVWAQWRKLRSQ